MSLANEIILLEISTPTLSSNFFDSARVSLPTPHPKSRDLWNFFGFPSLLIIFDNLSISISPVLKNSSISHLLLRFPESDSIAQRGSLRPSRSQFIRKLLSWVITGKGFVEFFKSSSPCLVFKLFFFFFSFQKGRDYPNNKAFPFMEGLNGLPPKIQITMRHPIPLNCQFKKILLFTL